MMIARDLDGGVKRVRLFGRRMGTSEGNTELSIPNSSTQKENERIPTSVPMKKSSEILRRLPILPLSRAGFGPYGSVIEAHLDLRANPPDIRSKVVNFGTATKFDHVARLETTNHGNPAPSPNLCVFSCQPWEPELVSSGRFEWHLKGLERHQFSSQTFIPLTTHTRTAEQAEQDLLNSQTEGEYLIVVALDSKIHIFFFRSFPPNPNNNKNFCHPFPSLFLFSIGNR